MGNAAGAATAGSTALLEIEKQGAVLTAGLNRPAKRNALNDGIILEIGDCFANLPDDVVLVPGIVGHATNVIEHPQLVADRIERFVRIVGPDRVIAATDCGLGGRVHPQIAWAKLEALAQGAELASKQLAV